MRLAYILSVLALGVAGCATSGASESDEVALKPETVRDCAALGFYLYSEEDKVIETVPADSRSYLMWDHFAAQVPEFGGPTDESPGVPLIIRTSELIASQGDGTVTALLAKVCVGVMFQDGVLEVESES